MLIAKISDGRTCLYQWDTGVKIELRTNDTVTEMHFVTPNGTIKRDVENNVVGVPDVALQTDGTLTMYAFVRNEVYGITRHEVSLGIIARPKPADYIDPPDESAFIDQVCDRLKVLPECKGEPGPAGPQGEPGQDAPQEAVLFTAQSLNDEQQAQARENVGAAGVARVETVETALAGKLDNAPDTWPEWSAIEQAAARERLGITEDLQQVFILSETWEEYTSLDLDVNNLSHFRIFITLNSGIISGVSNYGIINCTSSTGEKREALFELGSLSESSLANPNAAYCKYDINDVPTMTRWYSSGGNPTYTIRGAIVRGISSGNGIQDYMVSKIQFPPIKGDVRIAIWGR